MTTRVWMVAGITLLALSLPCAGATTRAETFLRADGLRGEATESGFEGCVTIHDHQVLTSAAPDDPKRTSWKLELDKPLDSSSVAIHRLAADGTLIAKLELVVRERFGTAGLLEVARYELKDSRLGERRLVKPRLDDGTQLERFVLKPRSVRIVITERDAEGVQRQRTESRWSRGPALPDARGREGRPKPTADWPFDQPRHHAAITLKSIAFRGAPVLLVSHDLDDHGWQFLGDTPVTHENAAVVRMDEIVGMDPTLLEIAHIRPGWRAWRRSVGAKWTIERIPGE